VAEALESAMSVHLATRQNLLLLRKDVEVLRKDMHAGFVAVRKEVHAGLASVRKDTEPLGDRLMVRLATFMTISLGMLFAELRYLP